MKNYKALIGGVAGLVFLIPQFSFAAFYTLTNGESFEGSAEEYRYANFLVNVAEDFNFIAAESWDAAVKKEKFPSLAKFAASASFSGDAGYNKKKKEFYISNSKGASSINIPVKHAITKSKVDKVLKKFENELLNRLDEMEIRGKFKLKEEALEDNPDLAILLTNIEDVSFRAGETLGLALLNTVVSFKGSVNNILPQPILIASCPTNNNCIIEKEDREDYHVKYSSNFEDEFYMAHQDLPEKAVSLMFELDESAVPNTRFTFKLNGVRALSSLKGSDIWTETE